MSATEVLGLFSDYRAEWPSGHFAENFVTPAYFGKLEQPSPCFLFGGRGTGKTTSLRSLRFDAAHTRMSRAEPAPAAGEGLPYLAIYLRMDKNQVRAFDGPELHRKDWDALFTHYFNLLACEEFCRLLKWLWRTRPDLEQPSGADIERIAGTLGTDLERSDLACLETTLGAAAIALELHVNNPNRTRSPILSAAKRPVATFATVISGLAWAIDKPIFCCIDEYENLLDSQQSILNTYIKHSEHPLSYKIGVRSNGLRSRETRDGFDPLQAPADYSEIDIPQEGFDLFARTVADTRLKRAADAGLNIAPSVDGFLESLSVEKEAELLGVDRVRDAVLASLADDVSLLAFVSAQPKSQVALVAYWHAAHPEQSIQHLATEWRANQSAWRDRWGNYSYKMLFWLSKGRKGAQIKKYYAGATAIIAMASGNIRYFMELIDRAIIEELAAGWDEKRVLTISARSQTIAAKVVGQRRLEQLEGVSEHGVRLKRLVLGIGRVLFERTRTAGMAPEQNFFTVTGSPEDVDEMTTLLKEGVGHLAFEAALRSKRTSVGEPNDDEYRIHPVFCAFFEISYRKKRRVAFDAGALMRMIAEPASGIAELLSAPPSEEADLPEQLALFAPFFRPKPPKAS